MVSGVCRSDRDLNGEDREEEYGIAVAADYDCGAGFASDRLQFCDRVAGFCFAGNRKYSIADFL